MQHMCLWPRSALPLQYPDCLVCRERRKQRFSDMEHVIDDLSAQLKQMSDIGNQNAMLQVCFPAAVRIPVRILQMVFFYLGQVVGQLLCGTRCRYLSGVSSGGKHDCCMRSNAWAATDWSHAHQQG